MTEVNSQLYVDAGNRLFHENKLNEALEYYTLAVTLEDDNFMLWYNLGYIQYCLGDYKEAKLSFEESIKLNPEFQKAHKTISVIENLRLYTMDPYS